MPDPKNVIPAQAGFIVTVGVPLGKAHDPMCQRALRVLRQAGFRAAVTSEDGLRAALSQIEAAAEFDELAARREKKTDDTLDITDIGEDDGPA